MILLNMQAGSRIQLLILTALVSTFSQFFEGILFIYFLRGMIKSLFSPFYFLSSNFCCVLENLDSLIGLAVCIWWNYVELVNTLP